MSDQSSRRQGSGGRARPMGDRDRDRGYGGDPRSSSRGQERQSSREYREYGGRDQGPPPESAWGRKRDQPPTASSGRSSAPYSRPHSGSSSQQSVGRATERASMDVDSGASSSSRYTEEMVSAPAGRNAPPTGGPAGDSAVSRGSMRGRRILPADLVITRPAELATKQGKTGNPCQLTANYFQLLSTTDWCLYQYRVDFVPEEDRTVVRKGLLKLHAETLGAYIFDGTNMYTSHRLPQPLVVNSIRESDSQHMQITIGLTGDLTKGDHHYLQFFNIIMRKCLDFLKLQLVGRNYFDALNKVEVREYKLELWPGYLTSIRQHEHNILMCSEITHKVMRNQTLLDILKECYQRYHQDFKARYKVQIVGLVVLTDYNNNTYKVDDVDFDVTPQSTFKKRDGTDISYMQYYQQRYGIRIQDPKQPLLVSRAKARDRRAGKPELVYLVPELCRTTGLTDDMRNDFRLMQALAKHTRVSPRDRIEKLLAFNKRLRVCGEVISEFKRWNLKLDEKLVKLPGRILPEENITFAQGSCPAGDRADWTRELRNKMPTKVGTLTDWALVTTSRCSREANNFIGQMIKAAAGMRFNISNPSIFELGDDRPNSYTDMLEQIKSRSNPQLVFCVVPNNRADRYSAIKKKCCLDRPVPTQVFLAKNLSAKGVLSIATKVAIQVNCKIGGIPWSVEVPLQGLMVVGFDVCHDTNQKDRDFGAMVASLDAKFGRYFSAVTAHSSGEELSNDLSVNLCKALDQYRTYNKELPKRIVIYRDGVGEGQIPFVFNHEVQNIRQKLNAMYGNPDHVKMAFIVVTKKINTRLFFRDNNPPPGTVVDDVITDPTKYDFLLVSQSVHQGTVSPTAYSVISDSVGLDADKLQRLTYKLTHMYYNWSGTVRVPAPCQYAHKLAFLVAQAVHRPPSTQLETLLYFL